MGILAYNITNVSGVDLIGEGSIIGGIVEELSGWCWSGGLVWESLGWGG